MAIREKKPLVKEHQPQTFHLFAKLPIELRFQIWSYNLPEPRIVEIKCHTEPNFKYQLRQDDVEPTVCKSTLPVPVNLHVCRESRFEALKRYQLLFSCSSESGRIYFDPLRDTLYLGLGKGTGAKGTLFNTVLSLVQPADLACVRRVAINEGLFRRSSCRRNRPMRSAQKVVEHVMRQVHRHFTNLERITFVYNDRNPIYSPEAVFVQPTCHNRILERQIREAIQCDSDKQPQRRPLIWDIRAIAAEPTSPAYDQSILGYSGSRSTFFKECQLPEIQRVLNTWCTP
ncbi:hypothetical protein M426DRAFT_26838 [Hypoxylon sp. CI-4A]|nr:hypothetical protein M426DRAFT_26838 [Hypoxylon sp. CI-4A]